MCLSINNKQVLNFSRFFVPILDVVMMIVGKNTLPRALDLQFKSEECTAKAVGGTQTKSKTRTRQK